MKTLRDAMDDTDAVLHRCKGLCAGLDVIAFEYLVDKTQEAPEAQAMIAVIEALSGEIEKAMNLHATEWELGRASLVRSA